MFLEVSYSVIKVYLNCNPLIADFTIIRYSMDFISQN